MAGSQAGAPGGPRDEARPGGTGAGTGDSVGALAARVLDALRPLAAPGRPYALLDFPAHYNVGDSAIWEGELQLLGRLHGAPPALVSHNRYPPGRAGRTLPEGGVIYLHGGGNLGDLWPRFQAYREAVIRANPGRRIVQLPQTIHYGDPRAADPMARAVAAHPDVHLLVRDEQSAAFARARFDCPVALAPDSAFGIDMTAVPRARGPRGLLAHLRLDHERREDNRAAPALFAGARVADWPREPPSEALGQKALLGLFLALPQRGPDPLAGRAFAALARRRARRGFALLDAAEVVVTDRLHGHVMCRLLGKPHVVVDNSYGKIARFMAAWGSGGALAARDYREARALAEGLLAGQAHEGA